jgi:TRAP-type transport system small permease protein
MQERGKISKALLRVNARLRSFSGWVSVVSGVVLIVMMLLDVADVIGRYFFLKPIPGTYELIALLLICCGTWGMASAEFSGSHVRVNLLVQALPQRLQKAVDIFGYLILLCSIVIITWQMFARAVEFSYAGGGMKSELLGIPYSPFFVIFGVGVGLFSLVILLHLIVSCVEVTE